MEPVISALQEHYGDRVIFIVADLDNPRTALFFEDFEIYYIPAFYFIDSEGQVLLEEAGVFSFEEMESRVELIIGDVRSEEREKGRLEIFFSETLPAALGEKSFLVIILVLAGGIITSISPCILTMIPLLIGYIVGYGEGNKFRGFSLSALFVTGMALTFAIMGFLAASFGRVFGEIGTAWYYIIALVALVMGLNLLGVLNFNMPGLKEVQFKKAGPGGTLAMGMLFGLVASPCATPVLAVIIAYAAAQAEPLYGSGLLFIYGVGHGLPLLVAGTFTGMARNLPAINRYTRYLGYASGIVLIVVGLYLLYQAAGT
jgi:cytochrome c-type biogenesis protein